MTTVNSLHLSVWYTVGCILSVVTASEVDDVLVIQDWKVLLVEGSTVDLDLIDTQLDVTTFDLEPSSARDTSTGSDTSITEVVKHVIPKDVLSGTYEEEVLFW